MDIINHHSPTADQNANGPTPRDSPVGRFTGLARRTRIAIARYGLTGLAQLVVRRVMRLTSPCFTAAVQRRIEGSRGFEVGGPTTYLFGPTGYIPIYPLAARVDNINFAAGQTSWENVIAGDTFVFDPDKPPGTQFVGEATQLPVGDALYDFLLSSHTIEHTANPLRALREWHRVLRSHGLLFLVAPDPTRTFDRRRPVTTLEHLAADEAANTSENDATHVQEVVEMHDMTLDPWAPQDPAAFAERCIRNHENRCLHHHVFDIPLLSAALQRVGFVVVSAERALPDHLILIAEKP